MWKADVCEVCEKTLEKGLWTSLGCACSGFHKICEKCWKIGVQMNEVREWGFVCCPDVRRYVGFMLTR
jgi:hypothetical protein